MKDVLPSPACCLSVCLLVAITPPSDRVYMQAAAVFRQLRPEKPANQQRLSYGRKADKADSKDESVERRAFQLAFSTLKCKRPLCLRPFWGGG